MDQSRHSQQTTARRRIIWLLRITIVIQAVGIAAQYLFTEFETESPLFSYLLYDCKWPQETAQRVDDIGTLCWLFAGLTVLLLPLVELCFFRRRSAGGAVSRQRELAGGMTWIEFLLLLLIFVLQIVHVYTTWYRGTGERFNDLVPLARIARWMTPVLLAMLLPVGGRAVSLQRFAVAMWLLRLTAATTFIAHGIKAVGGFPPFVDYLLVAASSLLGWDASEATMTFLLQIIGGVDIAVAILLLTRRWRSVAIYMTLWAFIGAMARVVHSGLPSTFEVAIRSGNYCLPLAVALYFHCTRTSHDNRTIGETDSSEEIDNGDVPS